MVHAVLLVLLFPCHKVKFVYELNISYGKFSVHVSWASFKLFSGNNRYCLCPVLTCFRHMVVKTGFDQLECKECLSEEHNIQSDIP